MKKGMNTSNIEGQTIRRAISAEILYTQSQHIFFNVVSMTNYYNTPDYLQVVV